MSDGAQQLVQATLVAYPREEGIQQDGTVVVEFLVESRQWQNGKVFLSLSLSLSLPICTYVYMYIF